MPLMWHHVNVPIELVTNDLVTYITSLTWARVLFRAYDHVIIATHVLINSLMLEMEYYGLGGY